MLVQMWLVMETSHPGLWATDTCSPSCRVGSAGHWPRAQIYCFDWGVWLTRLVLRCPPGIKYYRTALGKHWSSMEQSRDFGLACWYVFFRVAFPSLSHHESSKVGWISISIPPHILFFLFLELESNITKFSWTAEYLIDMSVLWLDYIRATRSFLWC